ncbi:MULTISPECIES: acyl carrier protein [Streptacidiphilus]|uniref:Acyl carrier protein n=2 Tax=Streptacidiphilus TaxID=228398 RepID=A0ABV6UML4_9ACTN|nr:acyl carrier protein [Streptacidiphilus jeojiense]
MSALTIDDLKEILRAAAGEDESVGLDGDIAETPFTDLGYDSLALLETAAVISRRYGVTLTDDLFDDIATPQALLDEVNSVLSAAA